MDFLPGSYRVNKLVRNVANQFNNKWGECDIIVVAVQIYVLTLIFASTGQPISGNKNIHVTGENAHLYWLCFIVFFSLCHLLATYVWPTSHSSAPYWSIGILFQVCGVVVSYTFQPPQLGCVPHILYATVPATYLFWFLWRKLHQENSVRHAKLAGVRKQHGGQIFIVAAGLTILLCTAITVCLIGEFSIIQSIKHPLVMWLQCSSFATQGGFQGQHTWPPNVLSRREPAPHNDISLKAVRHLPLHSTTHGRGWLWV